MPFVIPRIVLPKEINCANAVNPMSFDPEPSVESLEKYEEWLCEELALVRETINVVKYGASLTEIVTAYTDKTEAAP